MPYTNELLLFKKNEMLMVNVTVIITVTKKYEVNLIYRLLLEDKSEYLNNYTLHYKL
jgi:hypothetical protein